MSFVSAKRNKDIETRGRSATQDTPQKQHSTKDRLEQPWPPGLKRNPFLPFKCSKGPAPAQPSPLC